jgi:hypothetical protein
MMPVSHTTPLPYFEGARARKTQTLEKRNLLRHICYTNTSTTTTTTIDTTKLIFKNQHIGGFAHSPRTLYTVPFSLGQLF